MADEQRSIRFEADDLAPVLSRRAQQSVFATLSICCSTAIDGFSPKT